MVLTFTDSKNNALDFKQKMSIHGSGTNMCSRENCIFLHLLIRPQVEIVVSKIFICNSQISSDDDGCHICIKKEITSNHDKYFNDFL